MSQRVQTRIADALPAATRSSALPPNSAAARRRSNAMCAERRLGKSKGTGSLPLGKPTEGDAPAICAPSAKTSQEWPMPRPWERARDCADSLCLCPISPMLLPHLSYASAYCRLVHLPQVRQLFDCR